MQDDPDDSRRASKTHSKRASKTQRFGFSELSARKLPTFASENYSSGQRFRKESDNTLSQSMVDNYSNQMKSVGILIFDGEVMGTVFRVGSKYVMTALHVVPCIIDPAKAFIHFDESAVDSDRRYKVQKSFIFNRHLDVAVLEIEDDGRLRDLPPKMSLSKYKFNGSEVSLIGYGNPNQSNRKNLDPRCLVIEPNSERMQYVLNWHLQNTEGIKAALRKNGRNARLVDLGYKGFDDDSQLMFDCFMVHGASGAPVLANNNAGSIQVVGVFTHGLPEFFFHLSDSDRLSVPKSCLLERGSKMNYIYTWIQRDYPEIVNDLFH